jgi:hypothetical protein
LPSRCCRYCQQFFQPSKYRPDQTVCSAGACQRQRCTDYHRQKLTADTEYVQVVRDSQRKWREANADYQRQYRQKNVAAVEQNRQRQRQRDRRRRVHNLVKNNVALDLKRCAAEVWLVGPAAGDLDKNNLALSQFLIFQPVAETPVARAGS